MTDLIEQIADELATFLPERDEGQDSRVTLGMARAALAAITASGHEVVKLPEANGINNSFNSAVVRNGTVVYEDTFWLTPTQARNDAADLVAAAEAAEVAR